MAPKDVHVLILRTYGCYPTRRKGGYQCRIKIADSYVGLFRWVQCNHKGPNKKRQRSERNEEMLPAGFDAWKVAANQGIQVASRSWKSQGNGYSPRTSRKECSPANTFILAQ